MSRPGLRPLPVLTVINFLTYLDRQIVYGMLTLIGDDLHLSKAELGWIGTCNLLVFATVSLVSGPLTDRYGPRRVIFAGIAIGSAATIAASFASSYAMLLVLRAFVGVGEGAYSPSANALLCADAPPERRGRAMSIYNVGMALGGSAGLLLGAVVGPEIGWRNALLLAGVPGLLLAAASLAIRLPARVALPERLPARAYLLSPNYLLALAGGIAGTFGASAMVVWAETMLIGERQFGRTFAGAYMLAVGLVCGIGGVLLGGWAGDRLSRRASGGHALAVGGAFLLAVVPGVASLLTGNLAVFLVLCPVTSFFLSVYNGPSVAIVDELAPARYAATLQGNFLFFIHLLGNAPAPAAIGWTADRLTGRVAMPVSVALVFAMGAFALSGVLFVILSRRQRRAAA